MKFIVTFPDGHKEDGFSSCEHVEAYCMSGFGRSLADMEALGYRFEKAGEVPAAPPPAAPVVLASGVAVDPVSGVSMGHPATGVLADPAAPAHEPWTEAEKRDIEARGGQVPPTGAAEWQQGAQTEPEFDPTAPPHQGAPANSAADNPDAATFKDQANPEPAADEPLKAEAGPPPDKVAETDEEPAKRSHHKKT